MGRKSRVLYRTKLSFSQNDFRAKVALDHAGINLLLPRDKEQSERVREQLGLFGSGNNSNTFYSGASVQDDIVPKPEDYIEVPFRLLSETIVAAGSWRSTDFSRPGVLQQSAEKLVSKPVYHDHDTELANWLGTVKGTSYSKAYVDSKGNKIPGGIDGILSIDAKANPKFARGVLSGAIFSNSVTVDFGWEMSHFFKDINEFEAKVGQMHSDGKMITRLATEIHDYYETSLVWLGADPFAKRIEKNGDLTNPDLGSAVSFSLEKENVQKDYKENKKYYANVCLEKESILSLRQRYVENPTETTEKPTMNKELLALLKVMLGLEDTAELTKEHLNTLKLVAAGSEVVESASFATFKEAAAKVTSLEATLLEKDTKVTELTTEVTSLKADKVTLEPLAEIGKASLTSKKAEIERLYKISVGATAVDPAVVSLITEAKPEALDGLLAQYTKGVTEKFKGSCTSCGSTDLTFKSSLSDKDLEPSNAVTPESISREALARKYKYNTAL